MAFDNDRVTEYYLNTTVIYGNVLVLSLITELIYFNQSCHEDMTLTIGGNCHRDE